MRHYCVYIIPLFSNCLHESSGGIVSDNCQDELHCRSALTIFPHDLHTAAEPFDLARSARSRNVTSLRTTVPPNVFQIVHLALGVPRTSDCFTVGTILSHAYDSEGLFSYTGEGKKKNHHLGDRIHVRRAFWICQGPQGRFKLSRPRLVDGIYSYSSIGILATNLPVRRRCTCMS